MAKVESIIANSQLTNKETGMENKANAVARFLTLFLFLLLFLAFDLSFSIRTASAEWELRKDPVTR